ncbi:single-stranded-DNA-specific exonuclease RecJ [Paenibacillus sacheonensis]|uniref:Single-stranded-DNA-specific exonuclease RecJ n=1 Tax=Paenibacillus sacheonensis TaxID=742054 RepID=A0A7X5BWU8_9BACL|nr:single-stranded-DNA-specific exonuclease RecJ [Paenibacillus sacheonensis]MBM7563738.1 single-stranded-DNA-specific exonuclease [Paenibacillus sacheonensis]NBC67907.1 single-stranded-DNA-specific exonuclease RecJ [Paenibacillus sacheonensis]
MLQSKTRWNLASLDVEGEARAAALARSLSLTPLVARLLVQRGYDRVDAARQFLDGGAECLHDPFLLKGMKEAVDRISLARERGERIRIYGDYDADGVSSTTLMTYLFTRLELNFDHYIPHRTLEGYGLNNKALDAAAEAGVTLIVTVDTGISAVEEIAYAAGLGIDVVVTDHHEPPHQLPAAYAIVNPKQEDCDYPFKGLAGVGVAFKLATALLGEPPLEWTDVVALGTIADLMPLTDENRVLVRFGLEQLRQSDKPGFRALAEVGGVELPALLATHIAFSMAPRINAAGRLEHANSAVALLTSVSDEEAAAGALHLDILNKARQGIVEEIVQQAQAMWAAKCEAAKAAGIREPSVIVLAGEGWNPGVVGIVASKMVEKHYKPTIILGMDAETGKCKGSARSIEGYDLHAALTECEQWLDHYGGHQAAAGMTLHRDNLMPFEERLSQLAEEWLQADDWIPKMTIDLACKMEDATLKVREQLSKLEPFGAGNASPKLLLTGITLADRKTMGKEHTHLKLALAGQGKMLDAVGFGYGYLADRLANGAAVEVVGELAINEWNGQRKAQFMLSDLRVPHIQLFDKRNDPECESFSSLERLFASTGFAAGAQGVLLVPNDTWAEAAERSDRVKLPPGFRLLTYGALIGQSVQCRHLAVHGKPPAAEMLSKAVEACQGLESVHLLYEVRKEPGPFPTREQFGQLYQLLRRECPIPDAGSRERLAGKLSRSAASIDLMLSVFEELEFISLANGTIELSAVTGKKELTLSRKYREGRRSAESDAVLGMPVKQLTDWLAVQASIDQNEGNEQNEGVLQA